jgi:S1-C subfamily serine protease
MDPKEKARVTSVTPGTPAEAAGFKSGDDIVSFSDQPILSIADLQWVLQQTGESAKVTAEVSRGGKLVPLVLRLDKGWRQRDDISWRATSWDLRRMATGGILFEELTEPDRRQAKLSDTALALRIKHLGQYSPHDVAKKSGFKQGDILIELAGSPKRMSESELLAHLVNAHRPGDSVAMTVLRDGQRVTLKLPMQ